uniref:NADH-ubiquinone oxidoreductase chain 2 n=1 Tax=Kaestneriella sp. KaspPE TaxID=2597008 RepID=A0A8K1ZFP7_9NEOP|nr:NADH dehydrogenase subunit 2 [Kaestneriella sp. KaspPE]
MKNNLNILFLITLILGTLFSISSSNWLGVWMGLELNMLSFIPMLASSNNILSSEASLKYFLVQAVASIIFICSAISNILFFSLFNNFNFTPTLTFFLSCALLLKLGAAPFQTWFISIMNGLSWFNCLVLMTWQKITPLCVMLYLLFKQKFIFSAALLSLVVGAIGGLNQTQLKKILAFSSVSHLGWLLTSFTLGKTFFLNYLILYTFMNTIIIWICHNNNLISITQTFMPNLNWSLLINILSLGGLPPFLGFLPKFLILQNYISSNNLFMSVIMVLTALITLFYYLRLTYSSLLLSSFSKNPISIHIPTNDPLLMVWFNGMTIFGLLLWNLT